MNLLGRIWLWASLIIVIPAFFSCVDPVDVGVELDPEGIKVDVLFEEIWLPSTNVLIDSVRTNQTSTLLVGSYNDPVFGATSSIAYTQITTNNSFAIRNDSTNAFILDSLVLQLRPNFYHSDAVGLPQEFFIHQLEDTLFTNVFYLSDFVTPLSTQPIGQLTERYSPDQDTLLRFDLAESFGNSLLDVLAATSLNGIPNIPAISINARGLGIRGGDNNTALIGFDPNHEDSKMTLYFQIENERDSLFIEFQFNASSIRYHSTTTDRSNALLSGATTHLADFDVGDGRVYLQPGSGIFPKLDITPLNDFLGAQSTVIVNSAEIELGMQDGLVDQQHINPNDNFRLVFIKDNQNVNVPGLANTDRINTLVLTNAAYITGLSEQLVSRLDTTTNNFEGDITLFTQLLHTGDVSAENLILMPLDGTTFNQSIFDQDSIRVRLFYTIPKN